MGVVQSAQGSTGDKSRRPLVVLGVKAVYCFQDAAAISPAAPDDLTDFGRQVPCPIYETGLCSPDARTS
jgi:hypothetical protein